MPDQCPDDASVERISTTSPLPEDLDFYPVWHEVRELNKAHDELFQHVKDLHCQVIRDIQNGVQVIPYDMALRLLQRSKNLQNMANLVHMRDWERMTLIWNFWIFVGQWRFQQVEVWLEKGDKWLEAYRDDVIISGALSDIDCEMGQAPESA